MKNEYVKAAGKLYAARLLFVIVTFIFLIPLGFLSGIWGGALYSVLTAIPYLGLIYYDMRDKGAQDLKEVDGLCFQPQKGFFIGLLGAAGSLVLLALLALSAFGAFPASFATMRTVYHVYYGPFMNFFGGQVESVTLMHVLAPAAEILLCGVSYLTGARPARKLRVNNQRKMDDIAKEKEKNA